MLLAILLSLPPVTAPDPPVREVASLQFHSAFWPNLHHTLYAAALPKDRRSGSAVMRDLTSSMKMEERAIWERAVAYYVREFADKDLRTGAGMSAINDALAASGDTLPADRAIAPAHLDALRAAAPVYRRVLWPEHDRLNRTWIGDVAARLERIAPAVIPRLARVFATPWFARPVRIDITYYGRAYTYLIPVQHSILASGDPLYAGWAGAEMTLHEVSHGLMDPLTDALARESNAQRRDVTDLWHLGLFYMVGETTREAIAATGESYTPYLYAAGVIDRAWPSQRGIVEAQLKPFVDDVSLKMDAAVAGWVENTPLFRFRLGFWNNLHHFLYVLGRDRNQAPDRLRAAVAGAPKDVEGLSARTERERAVWDEAIGFYAGGLSTSDAVFDGGLVAITRALAAAPDSSDLSGLGLDATLVAALQRAAPVYRAVWWPRHSRADTERRDELQALVAKHGAPLVKRLTAVYGTQWPAQPRTIDVAAYTNWAGAYSTDGGLIEFASTDAAIGGVDGLETLLHEASHQWDAEIGRRLIASAMKQGKRVSPALSHAMIFYTSGAIVKEAIPDHVPYADKNGIWQRGGNPAIKPLLDRYWLPYLRGQGTFDEAIAAIIAGGL